MPYRLTIHADNNLSDKFVPPCHVGYFINGDRRKLTARYIAFCTLSGTKFCIFIFQGRIYQRITH